MGTLGHRIKEIRNEQSLTQQQFADSISVSRPFISRVEADKENPSDSLLKLISAIYNVKYNWLKTGTGEKQSKRLPYTELQNQILNSETLDLLLKNGNEKNYSFCLSVLMSILQNPKVETGSRLYYMEQIKMILVSIDYYLKNTIVSDESFNYSVQEELEMQSMLHREFLANIQTYMENATRSKKECGLDALLDE